MMRLTLAGTTVLSPSGTTVWNSPLVNSLSGEAASLLRSSDLGVKMISGLRNWRTIDRKSTRLNSSHSQISDGVFCFKKEKRKRRDGRQTPITQDTAQIGARRAQL